MYDFVAIGGSSQKTEAEGMRGDGETCRRCLAADKECVRPAKGGMTCMRCKGLKKKCEVVKEGGSGGKKEKRETAPLPKRAYRKSGRVVGGIREAGVTAPESSGSGTSKGREVVVVKPRIRREVTSREVRAAAGGRATKRKRVEEEEEEGRREGSRFEAMDRRRGRQGQRRGLVMEEGEPVGGGRGLGEGGNVRVSVEKRLAKIEETQSRIEEVVMMMNERLTSTLASVQVVEEVVQWMGGYFDSEEEGDEEDGNEGRGGRVVRGGRRR